MIIGNCMKKNVFSISSTATIREAISVLVSRHIGLLPILDEDKKPVGVVGMRDLLQLALPSVITLMEDVDFIGDFGAIETKRPTEHTLDQPITSIMRSGRFVDEGTGLLRAYALMLQYDLHDLPVVDKEGRLIGIASRVDIATTIMATWV